MHLEGDNVPVDIDVWKDHSDHSVRKRRVYHFPNRKPFVFESRMELDANGQLAEHVGGGFGMYVRVAAAPEGLDFADAGYFLQIAACAASHCPVGSALAVCIFVTLMWGRTNSRY